MNIPIIQNFFIKKNSNASQGKINLPNTKKIKKIILLIDESHQNYKSKILIQMKEFGFKEEDITMLIYTKVTEKDKIYEFPTFSPSEFNVFGTIKSLGLTSILNNSYDLLINFYETNNPFLFLVSNKIKADFKVGMYKSNNKNNHLLVECSMFEIKNYIFETVKYLKILNKI